MRKNYLLGTATGELHSSALMLQWVVLCTLERAVNSLTSFPKDSTLNIADLISTALKSQSWLCAQDSRAGFESQPSKSKVKVLPPSQCFQLKGRIHFMCSISWSWSVWKIKAPCLSIIKYNGKDLHFHFFIVIHWSVWAHSWCQNGTWLGIFSKNEKMYGDF